jgi:hypothetical protein
VASTIKAASLLAAGQAAGFSAKVAALTEGVVKALFGTKLKSTLAVVGVVGLALAGAAGLLYQTQAADQPKGKEEPISIKRPPAAKARRCRIVVTPILSGRPRDETVRTTEGGSRLPALGG